MNPLTLAYPIIAAALVWFGLHLLGLDTHLVDGILFVAAVVAEVAILLRGSKG